MCCYYFQPFYEYHPASHPLNIRISSLKAKRLELEADSVSAPRIAAKNIPPE
jgi:hypothetical protein